MSTSVKCLLVLSFITATVSQDDGLIQFNITAPNGTSNHGNPHLLCVPASQSTVLLFFLGNYFAHAATMLTKPSASAFQQFNTIINALLWPASGLTFALTMISRFLTFRSLLRFLSSLLLRGRRSFVHNVDTENPLLQSSSSSHTDGQPALSRGCYLGRWLRYRVGGVKRNDKPGIQ
jgi:hypothetical protein